MTTDSNNELLNAALEYIKCGLRVVPLKPRTKKARILEWQNSAFSTIDAVREHWVKYPGDNVAVLLHNNTGGGDFAQLDIESVEGHGVDGFAGMRAFEEAYNELLIAPTLSYQTWSRGEGRIYKRPESLPVGIYDLSDGVQLRAKGYAVMPPSYVEENGRAGSYTLTAMHILALLPEWVASAARDGNKKGTAWGDVKQLPDKATPGNRHDTLVSLLGTLFNRSVPMETALDFALAYNAANFDPPHDETTIRETVADCYGRFVLPPTRRLTRGDKLIKAIAGRRDAGFTALYTSAANSTAIGETTYDSVEKADFALIEKFVFYCNGNKDRVIRLAFASPRFRDIGDADPLFKHIAIAISGLQDGFEDADVIEYLKLNGKNLIVSPELVATDILSRHSYLTPTDTQVPYFFETFDGDCGCIVGVFKEHGWPAIHEEIERLLKHRMTTGNIKEVISFIKARTYIDRDDLDSVPRNLIPLRNGVFDIDTGELTDYTPETPFFYAHNGGYYPELLNNTSTAACRAITSALPDYDDEGGKNEGVSDAEIFREVSASCYYRDQIDKIAAMLIGRKDSGKSILLGLLSNAVGRHAIATRTLQDLSGNRFAAASLYHKTANIQADIGSAGIETVGKFNTITGGDRLTAEKKGVDGFDFYPYATLVYSTNDLPKVSDKVPKESLDAFYERWILIEMTRHFVDDPDPDDNTQLQKDDTLRDRLREQIELDWFTTWAISRLPELAKKNKYSYSASAADVKTRWINKTDSLASFVESEVEYTEGCRTDKTAFVAAYKKYCETHDLTAVSLSMIGRRLPTLIHTEPGRSHNEHYWKNISLKGVPPVPLVTYKARGATSMDDDNQVRLV